jgi:predicted Zn-dependent peptidase
MQLLGKSTLDIGRVEPLPEIFSRIEAVTASELRELANEILTEDNLSLLQYVPEGK